MASPAPSIGIQLPTVDGLGRGYQDLRPTVRAAEQVGLDSVWVGDHLVANAPIVESVVAAATAAAVSDRLRVGFAVMIAALRHPAWIGKQISSLQAVSDGRIELGIGVGGEIPAEWAAAGVPVAERGRRTDVLLQSLPDLLTGREARLGPPWDATVPPLHPHGDMPRLWIGGRSDHALRRAVTYQAGWMALWSDEERIRAARRRMAELARDADLPAPPVGVQVLVHPSDDAAQGEAETAAFMEQVYRIPYAKLRRYAVTGDHDTKVERLSALVAAGATDLVFIPTVRDYAPHMEALGRLAAAVRGSDARW